MPILFDSNPEDGTVQTFDYDPIKDQVAITTHQDVTGFLDRMNAMRNTPEYSQHGMKEDWWHYASIPTVVEIELRKKGLDIYNKDHIKRILKEINTNYPYLRATDKCHL